MLLLKGKLMKKQEETRKKDNIPMPWQVFQIYPKFIRTFHDQWMMYILGRNNENDALRKSENYPRE